MTNADSFYSINRTKRNCCIHILFINLCLGVCIQCIPYGLITGISLLF